MSCIFSILDKLKTIGPVGGVVVHLPAGQHVLDVPVAALHTSLGLTVSGLAIDHPALRPELQQSMYG